MSSCSRCGRPGRQLAITGQHVWRGCRTCHCTWHDVLDPMAAWRDDVGEPDLDGDDEQVRISLVRGVLLTIGAVALAFTVRLALKPLVGETSPFLVFTPAVMLAASYAGIGAGLLATALSALIGSHFFLRSLGEPLLEKWDRVLLFTLVGVLITSLTAVIRDARRRLSASLWREQAARAQAEAANQAKDDFLALIAHELRTPASVVVGWVSAIRGRRLHGEQLSRALAAVERNARAQALLIEDILDTARMASGSLRFDREPIDLQAVVGNVVEAMQPALEEHGLRCEFECIPGDYAASGDPGRLQQAFANLLSNALKFTPAGGHVMVIMEQERSAAIVTVIDTGVGISPEFLPRLFRRFAQDRRTLDHSRQGLGLGLSICRHIVEWHGGRIEASSGGRDRGTTITVTLPLEHGAGTFAGTPAGFH